MSGVLDVLDVTTAPYQPPRRRSAAVAIVLAAVAALSVALATPRSAEAAPVQLSARTAVLRSLVAAGTPSPAFAVARLEPRRISPTSAFTLPPSSRCVRGRSITLQLLHLAHVTWVRLTVSVNGRRVGNFNRSHARKPVHLRGLPTRTFLVVLTAQTSDGRVVILRRTYRVCGGTPPPPPPPSRSLAVRLAGTGTGSVTGGGISCPGTCSHSYANGSRVTLTAAPASGSTFAGWSGAGCTGTGTCTIALSADQSVSADFTANPPPPPASRTLSVSVAGAGSGSVTGGGISCPGTCSHSYANGSTVTLTAAPASGSTFAGWSGAGCTGTGTCTVTMSADQSVTATFTTTPSGSPTPGSYSLSLSYGYTGSFYVSPDGTQLQDVSLSPYLLCSPSFSSFSGPVQIQFASIAIASDGSFSATDTKSGVQDNHPATYTYTFSGQITGTQATGSYREDIAFNNGTQFSCTSNPQTWRANRDTQGDQTATPPTPGSYTLNPSYGYSGSLYVSPDSTHLQDVAITPYLTCSPSFSSYTGPVQIQFASIPITNGAFSATATQSGVEDNVPATFTYTFVGHFHGLSSGGAERIAGQFREDISFANGTQFSCTTNPQTWTAVRDNQDAQAASPPPPGSYTLDPSYGYSGSLYVSPDSTELQDVKIEPYLTCSPNFSSYTGPVDIQFPSIPIIDGAFSATATQDGVQDNVPATFTYTFAGHFHGLSSGGAERIAGQFREEISFANGTHFSCTTDPQTWTAIRDNQGSQTASPPAAGSYSLALSWGYSGSFTVASGGADLQSVTITPYLTCSPSDTSFSAPQIQFPSIAVTNGAFSTSATHTGLVGTYPATFTDTFSGHFHGLTSNGAERAAGQFREDVAFNNGTDVSCTTGPQNWTATGP